MNAPFFYFFDMSFINIEPAIATFNDSPYPTLLIETIFLNFSFNDLLNPSDSPPRQSTIFLS